MDNFVIDKHQINRKQVEVPRVSKKALQNYHIIKRQAIAECNFYHDNFDSGNYNAQIWSSLSGGAVTLSPCESSAESHYWLYFAGSGVRQVVTRSLSLQGIKSISFTLLFGSGSNGCSQPTATEGITVDYKIGISGTWQAMADFNTSYCCTSAPALLKIQLPVELQLSNVILRWYQPSHSTIVNYDVWAIDEVKIGEVTIDLLYEDTFSSTTINTNLWLFISGGTITTPPCGPTHSGNALYFSGKNLRQAVTQYLDLSQAGSISFYLRIGSSSGSCEQAEVGESIEIAWRAKNATWKSLGTLQYSSYQDARYIFLRLDDRMRISNVQIKILQSVFAASQYDTWSIDAFKIQSYNTSTGMACFLPSDSFPTSTAPSKPQACNYYSDNFDTGSYKTSLWLAVTGVRIPLSPCNLPSAHHYAAEFYSTTNRHLVTHILDLRGVEYITFYLQSGYYSINNCQAPNSTEGIHVSYRITTIGIWNTLEYYAPSCCSSGKIITLYLPVAAQAYSVQLRWLQVSNSSSINYDIWVLDDVEIGENVDVALYKDNFSTVLNFKLWSSVVGGRVTTPPCGVIDVGNCLYFSQDGTREAVTQFLDLRQANAVSFYLMTASSSTCDGLNFGENIILSIRAGHSSWTMLQVLSNASSTYFYTKIPESSRVHSAQLRWLQNTASISGYDVWAIDTLRIHSTNDRTACSIACIYDDFSSGHYNTSVWSSVRGALVTIPPCSTGEPYVALYFNQSGTREAISQALDLRGLYAISFTLQIVNHNDRCTELTSGENVQVHYSMDGNNEWIELDSYSGVKYAVETIATISLPLEARNQFMSIRISQPSHSNSHWSLGSFGVYSPNQCPPSSVAQTTITVPTPTAVPLTPSQCNYYWDNFENGLNSSTLWSTTEGVRASLSHCKLPSTQRYGIEFYSTSTRQLTTKALDLRGVESVSFYLISGTYSNGCSAPSSTEGIYFDYRLASTPVWHTLEYFAPSCCTNGKTITLHIPSDIQTSSVFLRWSQPTHSPYTNDDIWILDSVQVGKFVDVVLYADEFSSNYDPDLWEIIKGGSIIKPPCGETFSGDALYFYQGGERMAITQVLDLRNARILSFYIRIGDTSGICESADVGEDIELSFRVKYSSWKTLHTFMSTGFREPYFTYIEIGKQLRVNGVQLRIRQKVLGFDSYDVWSIDNFIIISREKDIKCSLPCYFENFNSGSYDSTIWNTVNGGSVTIPPCSDMHNGRSLYFNGNGTRELISNSLDFRGLYAISFTLQIGSFDNDCDQAETGDDVILYYNISGSDWMELQTFSAVSYSRAITVTVPIPHTVRTQGVLLRWAQTQHSGSSQDTWFIDNVGVYSPDQCPPLAYQVDTPNPVVPSPNPSPSLSCNYYSDNFDSGTLKNSLWLTVHGVRVSSNPCSVPSTHHYAAEFYSSTTRQLVTHVLDLRGVQFIRFYLHSGCQTSNSTNGIQVSYRTTTIGSWNTLEYYAPSCCSSGKTITLYLPLAVQVNTIQIRWMQSSVTPSNDYGIWVFDDVEIGGIVDTVLYEDAFNSAINFDLWSSIAGASLIIPPCGKTDSDTALYFSGKGVREAITVPLDLRQATSIGFYLRIGSSDLSCENADNAESIELSYRLGANDWSLLRTFSSTLYRTPIYISIDIHNNMRFNGVQLRISQAVLATDSYDVWSIDSFTVHSRVKRPECTMACYFDGFYSNYNASLWSTVTGGSVAPLTCNTNYQYSNGLYFDGSGTRSATTNSLNLSGLYAISFRLQIVSNTDECGLAPSGQDVTLLYSVNNGAWSEFKRFSSTGYNLLTEVIVQLPVDARKSNVSIQIMQSNHPSTVWAVVSFGIYSPDSCPPAKYGMGTTPVSPSPLPYPSPTTRTVCNYYKDNFDGGKLKASLWRTSTGVQVTRQPCGLSLLQHYAVEFYSSSERQLITNPLDLRGVEYISFYLLSGSISNGCSQPSSTEGLYVAYKVSISSFSTLEYFAPSCCSAGAHFKIYLPPEAQTSSVSLKWYQSTYSDVHYDKWVLDDVQIGFSIDNHLYKDNFTDAISTSIWFLLAGGMVAMPPCGPTHSGNALYFSADGAREAITQQLDLRQAIGLSFYLRIGSPDGTCENIDGTEAILLSWRMNYGTWERLGSYNSYRESQYVYVSFTNSMQATGVQFQIKQSIDAAVNEDVWSIDDFIVHSMFADTLCTLACYSDDFNNGQYNSTLWATVDGATVTIPPCSNQYLGNSLYFDGSGTRQAVTRPIDVRGLYAISFYLHIGSFSGSCEMADSGEHVNLEFRPYNSSRWELINTYNALAFSRETRVAEAVPRQAQQAAVVFRWIQGTHSGALHDTWSIDNVGFHSPDECPPSVKKHQLIPSPVVTNSSIPSPSPTVLPLSFCNFYSDNFDNGHSDVDIWETITGVSILRSPCKLPSMDYFAMVFGSHSTREMVTRALDLRGVEIITFHLISGSTSNGCSTPSSSEGMNVAYRISTSSTWNTIEYLEPSCCNNGDRIKLYLPQEAQQNSVFLRWSQPSHSPNNNYDVWVLDDVQVGEKVDVILYKDYFLNSFDPVLWLSVIGGTVTAPPCGETFSGNALFFAASGKREAITQFLDLRQAKIITFYIGIGSTDGKCRQSDGREAVELSFRAGHSSWTRLKSFSATAYIDSKYVSVEITSNMQVHAGQLRLMQNILAEYNHDVWSIDNFEIHSIYGRTACSMPCIFDGFYSDTYNTEVWNRVEGARVTRPPCSSSPSSGLYFDQSGSRQAITQNLDLRGLYAISFTLQIVTYSNTGYCSVAHYGETVIVSYSTNNGSTWNELKYFQGKEFVIEKRVTVPLILQARHQTVSLRISQPSNSPSVWSLKDFAAYSPDECPPSSITENTTIVITTPTTTSSSYVCNHYSDKFDTGAYKNTLWATVTGVQIALQPCKLSYLRHYAFQFFDSSTREIITHPLDLRGVGYISFYLRSGSYSSRSSTGNGCWKPASTEGIYVGYKIGNSGYTTIQYYNPSCCYNGLSIKMYLPEAAKTTSISLRWSQSHSGSTNYDVWVLDDVKIGEVIETVLYSDNFGHLYNPFFWSTIQGGSISIPPCGATHSDNALYFNLAGIREAVTRPLDLRDATGMRFYLQIGSSTNVCENADSGEGITLSYRIGRNSGWKNFNAFSPFAFNDAKYVYFSIDNTLRYNNVQFRFLQRVWATSQYDTWSIDNFEIISSESQVKCSTACYSDNFESGVVNASLWTSTSGASIIIPPCNYGRSLYFTGNGTREAITNFLDLRGLYAISFTLQIGSIDNECDQAEAGDDVLLYYSLPGSNWQLLRSFAATNYSRATTITVPITRAVKMQGVSLRWAQTQHSGSSQDTWFIDNVGVYSPNQCPPVSYQTRTPPPLPTPSPPPPPDTCNYFADNFDTGEYKTSLWATVTGVQVTSQPCRMSHLQHYAMQFLGSSTREVITHALDLRGVDYITFFLMSGSYFSNGCRTPSSSEVLYISYKIGNSAYTTIEAYPTSWYYNGYYVMVYLPEAAKTTSVSLRWSQPSHTEVTNYDVWVLDDVKIGEVIETVLYSDNFAHLYNPFFWSTIQGGSVSIPPCGATHSDNALYFNLAGIREAVTRPLDLRDATGMRFYLQIGSSNNMCENADSGEGITLSYRIGRNSGWKNFNAFSPFAFKVAKYVYFSIDNTLRYNNVQFRFLQSVWATSPYDTWSIDNFEIISSEGQVKCSVPCYFDNFESGVANSSLWKLLSGASIIVPPCNEVFNGRSLYFTGSGTREAITNALDLRGLYAISFTLQIGSYDNECDQAETGDDIILSYSLVGSEWQILRTFAATSYTRAITVTVPISHTIRMQGVLLRWAQPQHSGSSQDAWFIDNVRVYSPDQCPPNVISISLPTPPATSSIPPPAPPETCNYFADNFDTGEYKTSLWATVTGVQVTSQPCRMSHLQHYAMQFLGSSTREVITHALDLRGVDYITFF